MIVFTVKKVRDPVSYDEGHVIETFWIKRDPYYTRAVEFVRIGVSDIMKKGKAFLGHDIYIENFKKQLKSAHLYIEFIGNENTIQFDGDGEPMLNGKRVSDEIARRKTIEGQAEWIAAHSAGVKEAIKRAHAPKTKEVIDV